MAPKYGPIGVLPIMYKILCRVVNGRIKDILLSAQSCCQAGFRPGLGCDNHFFAMTLLTEKLNEYSWPFWIAAVDFRKAFDTISHRRLWTSLQQQGVPNIYINWLKKLYTDQVGCVMTDQKSKNFDIGRGKKQGDLIKPRLFIATSEHVIRKIKPNWERKRWGIYVGTREFFISCQLGVCRWCPVDW